MIVDMPVTAKSNTFQLPERSGFLSAIVGNIFSLAESETKKANGTNHRHKVKYAIT